MKKFLLILFALASVGVSASNDGTFEWSNNSGSTIKVYRNKNELRAEAVIKRYCKGNSGVQSEKIAVNDNWYYMAKYCVGKEYKLVEYRHNAPILASLQYNASTIIDGVNFPHGDAFNKWLRGTSLKPKPEAIFTYEPWVVADNNYAFTRSTSVEDNTIYVAYLSSSGGFNFTSGRTCNYNTHVNYADTISVNGTPVKVNNVCIEGSNRIAYETIPGAGVDQIRSAFKRLNHVKVNEVVFSGKGFTKVESDLNVRNTKTNRIQSPKENIAGDSKEARQVESVGWTSVRWTGTIEDTKPFLSVGESCVAGTSELWDYFTVDKRKLKFNKKCHLNGEQFSLYPLHTEDELSLLQLMQNNEKFILSHLHFDNTKFYTQWQQNKRPAQTVTRQPVSEHVEKEDDGGFTLMVIIWMALGGWAIYLRNHNNELTGKVNKLEEGHSFLQNLNEKNQRKLDTSREEQNRLNRNISDLKYDLANANSELIDLRRKKQGGVSQESLDKANETIRAANKRISELKAEIVELEKHPNTGPSNIYREDNRRLKAKIDSQNEEIEELRKRMNAALDRASEAESARYHSDKYGHSRGHASEELNLRDKISTLEAKITNLAAEKMETFNELIGKIIECEKWEEDYRQLKIRHDNLERNAHNGGSNSTELGEVRRKLRTSERTLERVTKERDDYKSRWEELYRKGNDNVDLGEFKQLTVPYTLLGLRKGADKKEVRERIRRLSPLYHPDKGADGIMMKLLNQAANDM